MAENTPCFKGVPDGKVIKSEVPQSTISKKIHNYKQELVNSLSDHNLHNGEAQPISVWYGRDSSYVKLYTDGNYGIYRYVLDYIRQPYLVDWNVAAISYWRMAQSRLEMYNYKEMKDGYKVYVYSEMKVYTYNETSDSWGDGKSTSPSEELIMDQFPEYV
jgi:hypothetical protein